MEYGNNDHIIMTVSDIEGYLSFSCAYHSMHICILHACAITYSWWTAINAICLSRTHNSNGTAIVRAQRSRYASGSHVHKEVFYPALKSKTAICPACKPFSLRIISLTDCNVC